MHHYDISLTMPAIRTHNWVKFYESAKKACKKYKFEIVIGSPFDLPDELVGLENVKLIKDYGNPSRATQIANINATGEFIYNCVDDGVFLEDCIDKALDYFKENLTDLDVMNMRYREAPGGTGGEIPLWQYEVANHTEFHFNCVNKEWKWALHFLMKRKLYLDLGGIDCQFEYSNHGIHDLIFRIQSIGGKIYSPFEGLNCTWFNGETVDHAPIHNAQIHHDEPLFNSIYGQLPDLSSRLKLDLDNWQKCPDVWDRRFKSKVTKYTDLLQMKKVLIVYNTCGIRESNYSHYITCIESLLQNKFDSGVEIVISSCLNTEESRKKLEEHFGDKIHYSYIDAPLTVNITFNKTIIESVSKLGEFEYYMYVDSGVIFSGGLDSIKKGYDAAKDNNYSMVIYQVDTDHCVHDAGLFEFPLKGRNHIIPVGGACNGHVTLFSNEIRGLFLGKLMPDVFVAYCTESTYSFLVAATGKKSIILGDVLLTHIRSVDGPSLCVPHHSPVYHNGWNNLLFGRNAHQFINDKEAIDAGLGYEECEKIMMHKKEAYVDGIPLNKDLLKEVINKYFYLNDLELQYTIIPCKYDGVSC